MKAPRPRGRTMLFRDRLTGSVVNNRAHSTPDAWPVDIRVGSRTPHHIDRAKAAAKVELEETALPSRRPAVR